MSTSRRRPLRGLGALVLSTTLVSATAAVTAAPAAAVGDFYRPPASYSATPGSVIRTAATPLLLQIPGLPNQWPGNAKKMMYTSTLQNGKPTAVTGYVVEPTAPWQGKGPRPTVVIGPGTVGQGDQCAGSKMLALPMNLPDFYQFSAHFGSH